MIDEITKQLKPLINGKLIYLSQYGSHLYGLDTENSDLDFRGVYIPTLDDIILHKDKDEINTELEVYLPINDITPINIMDIKVDNIEQRLKRISKWDAINTLLDGVSLKKKVDVKIFSLQKFIQLCSKADTNALDLLFSISKRTDIEQYMYLDNRSYDHSYPIFEQIFYNREKLINTDRMQSPCEYAHKQAVKYGLKVERYKSIKQVWETINHIYKRERMLDPTKPVRDIQIKDYLDEIPFDNKHVKLVQLDNKGKMEDYLFVAGVNHMLNLSLKEFIKRLESKLQQEYFSERTTNAINNKDEVDWKAMSHALRISYEIKELMQTGNITFPLKDAEYLLDIKQGKINKEQVAEEISKNLDEIMEDVNSDKLGWKYDEEFWNEFILKEIKNGLY